MANARDALGSLLAAIGLGSFWGVTVAGQDLAREFLVHHGIAKEQAGKSATIAYGCGFKRQVEDWGCCFSGPLSVRVGLAHGQLSR